MSRKSVLRNRIGMERRGEDPTLARRARWTARWIAGQTAAWAMAAALMLAPGVRDAAALDRDGKQVLIEARIVAVTTGDAMQVLGVDGLQDLDLGGVECPAGDQPFAREARSFTQSRVSGREVPVVVFRVDEHGRLIGDIRLEGDRSLARELIAEGLGSWNHREDPNPELGALETEARVEGRGMWKLPELSRLPVLGAALGGQGQGGGDIEGLARAILMLSPGDRARLNARLGGGMPGQVIMTGPQGTDGARIIQRSTGRSSDLGIGFGDDGVRIRGGATEHQHTQDTQIQVFGPGQGGTLIIENGVVPGGAYGDGRHYDGRHGGGGHDGGGIVYLGSGGVFHRASCFGDGPLGKAYSRSDAVARGYAACGKCRP